MTIPTLATKRPCVFFDDARGLLGPLTDFRASFELRTGALTTFERMTRAFSLEPIAAYAPTGIAEVVSSRWGVPVNALPAESPTEPVLAVNGRCALPLDVLADIEPGQAAVEQASGDLICARLHVQDLVKLLSGEDPTREKIVVEDRVLLARPWDVMAHRNACIEFDLNLLCKSEDVELGDGVNVIGDAPVSIYPDATVFPGAMIDATVGPVVVCEGSVIRPGAVLIGPVYVGLGSIVTEQAVIRSHTAIGPVCKVGGEVGGAIFQGYANKAHAGYLGDSFVGEWVNLGAGTTGSNLLNTYSEITAIAMPHAGRERTGLQFFGCVLGDHTKTAISTRIMTGSVVHTGVMWAASESVSGCVKPFSWVTDTGRKLTRLGKFTDVARTVMGRRQVEPDSAYLTRLNWLHARAASDCPIERVGKKD